MANILVIDDEKSIRNTLKDILEYEKHTVDLAENGAEGLEKSENTKYDVILCDIKMPEMDGIEVLEKLIENANDVPVIRRLEQSLLYLNFSPGFDSIGRLSIY